MKSRLTLAAGLCAAVAASAQAEVKINDYVGVEGYVAATAAVNDPEGASSTTSLFDSGAWNLDSAFVGFLGSYKDFSGKVSLFYVPAGGGADTTEILDLYVSYTVGDVTLTGGKFLSYIGYESYHPAYMSQLTWGYASGVPGYHSGVKADYAASDTLSFGVSVTDSLMPGAGATLADEGDSDWSDGLGYEFVMTYTGVENLTVFVGLTLDDDDAAVNDYGIDIWASYAVSDALTVAGEVSYYDDASTSYILFGKYDFSEKFYTVARWSFQEVDATNEYGTYLTLSPGYVINDNFTVRAEVSYADSAASPIAYKGLFYGIQGLFTF